MASRSQMTRRGFVTLGAAAGAGLAIGYPLSRLLRSVPSPPDRRGSETFEPDPALWVTVRPDNTVSIVVPRCEMGQGATTALPMLVAEELEVEWSRVRTEWAPLTPAYGRQLTGASDSVRTFWEPLRQAGALAREMLIEAAARRWQVGHDECRAERGRVLHRMTGRALPYGALAAVAATLPLPAVVRLKGATEWRLIGQPVPRLDVPDKTIGRAVYGCDVRVPGMLVATVLHSPVNGGTLRALDDEGAREVRGVHDVICLRPADDGGCRAVAVVADDYWTAVRGVRALRAEWESGDHAAASSATVTRTLERLVNRPGRVLVDRGDGPRAVTAAARVVEATYETPYLAHAQMEPTNCTARVERDVCEIWVPTQYPPLAREVAARTSGLPERAVTVHQTLLGGGFGRRQRVEVVAEAVQISQTLGVPVQVLWSREEDIQHGYYRPATLHRLEAALDGRGWPVAWVHRFAGIGSSDTILVQGVDDVPYDVPNKRISFVRRRRGPVRVGPWRGLARSQNAFVTESYLDELAAAGGHDAMRLREGLLADAPRYRAVLANCAERAGWGRPLPPGRGRGVALTDNFGGICAQVVEASVTQDAAVRVHRVTCVVDCGRAVNPDIVAAQLEGGTIFGLSAALNEEITLGRGRVEQSNFHDYPVLRMDAVPDIDVQVVPSEGPPGAVGETAVPPVAPALANAIFAATGHRIRRLPLLRFLADATQAPGVA